jgi:hypothetical protein
MKFPYPSVTVVSVACAACCVARIARATAPIANRFFFIVFIVLLFLFVLSPALIAELLVVTFSQASFSNYPKTGHLYSLLGRWFETPICSVKPTKSFTASLSASNCVQTAIKLSSHLVPDGTS